MNLLIMGLGYTAGFFARAARARPERGGEGKNAA